MTRANDGAAPAPQETCLRQASGPVSGYASSSSMDLALESIHVYDYFGSSRPPALIDDPNDIS